MTKEWLNGDWSVTWSGVRFRPLDPRPEDIRLVDIAMALSNIARFGGHKTEAYTVAQHSVLVASRVPEGLRLPALLHDASEAYLGDIIRPVKHLPEFYEVWKPIESRVERCIELHFGLEPGILNHPIIKGEDKRAVVTEARDLRSGCFSDIADCGVEPWPERIERVWTHVQALDAFCSKAFSYMRGPK